MVAGARHAVTAVVLRCALMFCVVVMLDVSRASPAPQRSATQPPSQAALATRLVNRLSQAQSDQARVQALIAIMHSLHIGVYKGNGVAIVRGRERSPHDFYLYDLEVMGMAAALRQKEMWDLRQFAFQLDHMGIHPKNQALDPAKLYDTIVSGVRSAVKKPADPRSLLAFLLVGLGRTHHPSYDIAKNPPMSTVKFDALQGFLVVADTLLPLAHKQSNASAAPKVIAYTASEMSDRVVAEGSPCDFTGDDNSSWQSIFNILQEAALGGAIREVDIIHAFLLSLPIEVSSVGDNPATTHWGPAVQGHEGNGEGALIEFQIEARMTYQYPQEVIKCGALFGLQIPNAGPLPGLPVDWAGSIVEPRAWAFDRLRDQGHIPLMEKDTDQGGWARLEFKPKDEVVPGFGQLDTTSDTLSVAVDVYSIFGNKLGWLLGAMAPKMVDIPWSVGRHKPRGFRFDVTFQGVYSSDQGGGGSRNIKLSGEKCGDTPIGAWAFTDEESDSYPTSSREGSFPSNTQYAVGAHWEGPQGPSTLGNQESRDTADWEFHIHWPPAPPTVKITFNFIQGKKPLHSPAPQATTVPVTEASDCPEY